MIIDDAMYSGIHLAGTLDMYGYKATEKAKDTSKFQMNFHLVVPYVAQASIDLLATIHEYNKWITVQVYPIYRLEGIQELVECQKAQLRKITTQEQAQAVKFSSTLCPTLLPFK